MNATFIQARIDSLETSIAAIEAAIIAITTDGIESYRLDTGQSQTYVTKQDVHRLQKTLESQISMLATWENRLNGGHSIHVVPAW